MKSLLMIFIYLGCASHTFTADILMVTMGGTKSHKIPFWELARGLINRNHNITFLNGFPSDFNMNGLHEITPAALVDYIQNYTNWDLLGARMSGRMPITIWDAIRYTFQSCAAVLDDAETQALLNRKFDLAILDGAYPECALGLVHEMKVPFMYINTVGFYTGSLAKAGNPGSYAITPSFYTSFTDNMNLFERAINAATQIFGDIMHKFVMILVHRVVRQHLGNHIPHPYEIAKNVSFILENGHAVVSYPRPFLPNVAEVACIHCHPAKALPKIFEDFIASAGDTGFIYISMGSSVKAANMPATLRKLFLETFARLPYHVLWKYEGSATDLIGLPSNVMLSRWLPQQDILGHPKLRAFITHGGLLSMYESVYHGVPVVTMPVFCDHDVNSAKAQLDGYAIKLHLPTLTSSQLYKAVINVIHDPRYRKAARWRQALLLDQRHSPLDTSIYWTEYVLRHNGAYHLQSPARNMSWWQYYMIDIAVLYLLAFYALWQLLKRLYWSVDVIRLYFHHGTSSKPKKL